MFPSLQPHSPLSTPSTYPTCSRCQIKSYLIWGKPLRFAELFAEVPLGYYLLSTKFGCLGNFLPLLCNLDYRGAWGHLLTGVTPGIQAKNFNVLKEQFLITNLHSSVSHW